MPENISQTDEQGSNTPSKQATPVSGSPDLHASLALVKSGVIFKGAEEFAVTTSAINLERPGGLSKEKVALVEKVLSPHVLTNRTLMDISPQPGYFLFSAYQNKASMVTAVDTQKPFLDLITSAAKHLATPNIKTENANWRLLSQPSDIVLAMDGEQWFGSGTADHKGIDAALAKISQLTKYMAVVQSIELPSSNQAEGSGSISNDFEKTLRKYFKRVEVTGEADGKTIFTCFHSAHEIDLSCPLPEFTQAGKLISCRRLTEFGGLDYWSRVYDGENVIYKQATRELVQREASLLAKLNSQFFPRALEVIECGDSSVLVLEKIVGKSLEQGASDIVSSFSNFTLFALECLQILNELQVHGIQHRDIQIGNLLIRDGKPVLLDFGWAISLELPMFVPEGLLTVSEDSQICDVYSMGKILTALAVPKYPELLSVFQLMTEPDPVARVQSASDLSALLKLAAAAAASLPATAADLAISGEQATLLTTLIANLRINRLRFEAAQEKYSALEEKSKSERDHRLAVLEAEYDMVVTEVNKVISELHRVIAEKDQLLNLLDERQKLIEGITQGQAWRLANKLQRSKQTFGSMFGKSP